MAKRILIADDSVTIQRAFAMTFAGADDVTLVSARSADEGLAVAQRTHPDLIIADATMPGRSGYDLCSSIRSDPTLNAVPVLILASSQQPYDEGRGQKAGANGHLLKPWDTNAILERLRDTLQGGLSRNAQPSGGVPTFAAAPTSGRVAASLPTAAISDDEYGEISIDTARDTDDARAGIATPPPAIDLRSRVATPPPPGVRRPSSPAMPVVSIGPSATPPSPGSTPAMRPSLIPGMRPGAMPPARPGTMPVRPLAGLPLSHAPGGALPRPAGAPVGRTMIGLPAANIPIPGVMRSGAPFPTAPGTPIAPSRSPTAPVPPLAPAPPVAPFRSPTAPAVPLAPARAPTGPIAPLAARPASPAPGGQPLASATGNVVQQRLTAFAAKGPEYEAIAKLSREVIEQIVWEVVPELAEAIIREHLEKRGRI